MARKNRGKRYIKLRGTGRKVWLTISLVLVLSLGLCHPANALDIQTALSLATKNDANYRVKLLEYREKNANGWALIAAMGPRLMASGKIMRSRVDYSPDEIAGLEDRHFSFNDKELSIVLDQPILDMEKIYQARRGGCEMDIAEGELQKAGEELNIQVVEHYFTILAIQGELALAQAKINILENQLSVATESHALGLGDQSDLYDIQARYAATKAIAAIQEARVVDAQQALEELLGEPWEGELVSLGSEVFTVLPDHDLPYWLEYAQQHNVDTRISRLQSEAARLEGKIGAGRFLPALSFFVDYEGANPDQDLSGYGWERERFDYGLKVQMELLAGGRDLAEFAAREHRYQATKQRIIATHRLVTRKIKSSWNGLNRLLESMRAYQLAVNANRRSLALKEENYKEGLQTMLDVLNVQRDFFIVSNKYQNTRYDYVIALIKFRQLVGDVSGLVNDVELLSEL